MRLTPPSVILQPKRPLRPPFHAARSFFAAVCCVLLTGCGETTPTLSECVPHGECAGLSLDNTKAPFTAKDGNAAAGGKLYGKLCASCHGQDGVGVGVANGISLRAPMWHAARTDNQIRLTVLRGKGSRMPAFALSSEELRDVVAFLRTLRDEAVRPSQPTY